MSTPKPAFTRPSDEDPTPAPKRKRHRRHKHSQGKQAATATTTQECGATPITAHHERNRRTHQREKRRLNDLRAENEKLHRRLAAIYDALSLD